MVDVYTENVAEVDERGRERSQFCLSLPTILRKILEHFSTRELIGLSLVNKLWNFEARSVMKERGNLLAYFSRVRYKDCPCRQLVAFASDLEQMRVVPFSGIHLPFQHDHVCESFSKRSLDASFKVILDRLQWKKFSVTFWSFWETSKDCPALLLVKQILEGYCEVLEELSLHDGNEQFLEPIFQDRTLRRLKYLEIHPKFMSSTDFPVSTTFIKMLVSSAPNLQELRADSSIDLTVNMLEGSSAVLVANFELEPLVYEICEGLIGSIRSINMAVSIDDVMGAEQLNRYLPMLLEASRTTLKTFDMDYLFALPLMCYGICLENVTTLVIWMNSSKLNDIDPCILALSSSLDFTRVFPKVKQVRIINYNPSDTASDVVSAFVQQGTAVLKRALRDRALNIRLLHLQACSTIEDSTLPLLAQMFPHVKKVHTKRKHKGALFEDLRQHFLRLEEVIEHDDY